MPLLFPLLQQKIRNIESYFTNATGNRFGATRL